ncbi:MAG: hypothetical protein A2Y38_20110 [Spirochaetes bacterium GWB1_59_5]|nr:MAG: hypothetical protein A2Y38_20110 [Spirochaetes bacterium GWB1_59_5]
MITEAKDILASVLTAHPAVGLSLTRIVRSAADEKKAVLERAHPFASLISAPGSFDNTTSRRAARTASGGGVEKYFIRGTRRLPIGIRVWAKTENDADAIVSAFLPFIPHRWAAEGAEGVVEIKKTDASDFASAVSGHYVMMVEVAFSLDVAMPGGERPER